MAGIALTCLRRSSPRTGQLLHCHQLVMHLLPVYAGMTKGGCQAGTLLDLCGEDVGRPGVSPLLEIAGRSCYQVVAAD